VQRVPLAVRRSLSHSDLLGAIAGLALLVAFLASFTTAYLAVSTTAGVRDAFRAASATDRSALIQVRLADDSAAQSSDFDTLFSRELPDTTTVTRTLQSDPIGLDAASSVLVSGKAFEVDGSTGSGASMDAADAASLGLDIGDEIAVGDETIELTGTWTRTYPLDPVWTAPRGIPVLVDASVLEALPDTPLVSFTLAPDTERVTAADLAPLVSGLAGLNTTVRDAGLAPGGLEQSGDLGDTAEALKSGYVAVLGLAPVALALVAIVSGVAMALIVRLLIEFRRGETIQLRARGATAGWLVRAAVLEIAVVATPFAAIGGLLAWLIAAAIAGDTPPFVAVALPAALIVLVAIITTFVAARRDATTPVTRDSAQSSGRATNALGWGAVVLVVLAAVVADWQFLAFDNDTAVGPDPAAVLAPALTLVALASIALLGFSPAARAFERRVAAAPGIRAFDARQVARRLTVFSAPVLLIALAFGGTAFAAGYSATWGAFSAANGALGNGSDVRVSGAEARVSALDSLPGATAIAPVYRGTGTVGDAATTLVAVDADLAQKLTGTHPPDAGTLDGLPVMDPIDLDWQVDGDAAAHLTAWLGSENGELARIPLVDETPVELPDGGPWTLVALDIGVDATTRSTAANVTVDGIDGLTGWRAQDDVAQPVINGDRLFAGGLSSAQDARLMPRTGASAAVPATVTASLAERLGLARGDVTTLRPDGGSWTLAVKVETIAEVVPGASTDLAIFVDVRAAQAHVLSTSASALVPNEVWIASATPAATASAARDDVGESGIVTTSDSGLGATLVPTASAIVWIGALGSLVLSIGALVFVTLSLARSRRGEVVVLRTVGLGAAEQARGRRWELATAVVYAAAAGTIGGVLVSLLLASGLARSVESTAPLALAAPVQFDWLPWAVAVLVAVGGFAGVIVAAGDAVRRLAERVTPGEADR